MPFKLNKFIVSGMSDLTLPEYLGRGDTQDLGAARASVNYVQMPGGGHYDNYGDDDSPRVPTAISKRGVLYDTGGDSVREQVAALRARAGKRGRLEILWHDNVTWWTWARLSLYVNQRDFNTRLLHLPFSVTFMPQEGIWYAENEVTDDTVFSGVTTSENIVVAHAGTVNVKDAVVQFLSDYSGALTITMENYQTSQWMDVDVLSIGVGEKIVFDIGRKTVRLHKAPTAISSISRSGLVISVTTGATHGLSVSDPVVIEGTNYDGFYTVATVPSGTTLTVAADSLVRQPHGPQSPASGTISETDDLFGNASFSDPANWLWLVPGNNTLHFTSSADVDGSTFSVIFNPAIG